MTKFLRKKKRRHRPLLWRFTKWLLILLLLAGLFWCGQNIIQTETIAVEGAPSAFRGLRIVIVSDVHGKEFGAENERLLEKTAQLEPDLIVITGDLIHKRSQLSMVPALARGLSDLAPTYYVTGNHEWAAGCVPELKALLRENGVTVLSNEYVLFERAGQKLALMGADDPNGPYDQKTIAQLTDQVRQNEGEETYLLLLSHRNNLYETYAAAGADLTLAGHGHGGLVRLPFTDGLIGHSGKLFPSYMAGLYTLSQGQMVVSRGLGNELPLFRVLNQPHLPVVVLQ